MDLKERIETIIEGLMRSHDESDDVKEIENETAIEYLEYIDSIRFIELITEVENIFDIEIQNDDLVQENIKHFDTFVNMIEKYVNK